MLIPRTGRPPLAGALVAHAEIVIVTDYYQAPE